MAIYQVGQVTGYNSEITVGGLIFKVASPRNSGTGGYNTFLAIKDNDGNEQGFNTDGDPTATNNIDASKTLALKLSNIPIQVINGVEYFVIRLDLNESNGGTSPFVDMRALKLFSGAYDLDPGAGVNIVDTLAELNSLSLRYDLDAGGDNTIHLYDGNSGSGTDDYEILIPVSTFSGANLATDYVYFYAEFGTVPSIYDADGGFEEFNVQLAGSINGIKFSDVNSNGTRQAIGADGIAGTADDEVLVQGVTVYIDANGNGILDGDTNQNGIADAGETISERYTVTDANGAYSFTGVALGTWQIREIQPVGSVVTTGPFETVTIGSVGQVVTVDPIGNHYFAPSVLITKTFVNVTDGDTIDNGPASTTVINGKGDIANYTIAVFNNGETALTNVIVSDTLADAGAVPVTKLVSGVVYNSGDVDSDGILDIGETWFYTATQTATQADLDTNGGGDSDKDNTASVIATQVGTTRTVTSTSSASAPIVQSSALAITKVFNGWSGGDGDSEGDFAGDIATYTIVVTNTGNTTLTNVKVTDPLTGNTYDVGVLLPGQTSGPLLEQYTLTQPDLDSNATLETNNVFAGKIDNTATATSNQTGPATASANAPITYRPLLTIDKVVVDVDGRGPDASADDAGDIITYRVTVKNEGNVTLTNVTVKDPLTGLDVNAGTLAPGASWVSALQYYTVQQSDIDTNIPGLSDGDIDNTATADTDQTDKVQDSEDVPVVYDPAFTVEKAVSFDGITYDDADEADGPLGSIMQTPLFRVTVINTGNVTLTGFTIGDVNYTFNAAGETIDLSGAVLTESMTADGKLEVGETWTIEYEQPLDLGYHKNTVTVDFNETGPKSDDAFYYVLVNDGPGVRTPGFWQNPNNGATFWDGKPNNQAHNGETFPGYDPVTGKNSDILYVVDTDCDGTLADEATVPGNPSLIDTSNPAKFGLLIGDYDLDGITDPGEDTIFISYADAQKLINASSKQGNDGIYTLGRDVVATWLNYLAGNNIDPTDGSAANIANAPKHYLDDAIDWLQQFASNKNSAGVDCARFEFDAAVKASSKAWKDGSSYGGDHGAGTIHTALDAYNNDGMINGEFYAGDGDSDAFGFALASARQLLETSAQQDPYEMMLNNSLVPV